MYIFNQKDDTGDIRFFKMGRGKTVYLSYTALVLLSAVSSASAGLWTVDIDDSPAPAPQDGPPFSAHASRNLGLLPYQIIGIVAAYVGSVLIIGTLLLTVGRSLRKRALNMAAKPQEMIKPMIKTFDPSPVSPGSTKSWYSPKRLRNKKSATSSIRSGVSNHMSPGMDSVVSFDNTVIEADRARRQEEMERLYAAVMAQQNDRKSQANGAEVPFDSPPNYSRNNVPRLLTDDPALRHLQLQGSQSDTPKSPVRAIYPPDSNIPDGLASPRSPIKAEFVSQQQPDFKVSREARTPSFGSAQTSASVSSPPKKLRKSLRNIKISAPLVKDDNSDGARTPLSPRFYTDPGVPPEPPTARTMDSQEYPPTTPGTGRSWRYGEGHNTDEEEMDEVRDLPQPNPQRLSAYQYDNQAQAVTDAASIRPDPTKSAPPGASNGRLPFREMNRQYAAQNNAQQQAAAAFPLSPRTWNAQNPPESAGRAYAGYSTSAGPVKTTFLEARQNKMLGTPRTGMATPYSPYMPFTPLTPVTPHLASKAERKQRQKEEKAIRGVITEEDQVADDKELWSSGY